MDKISYHTVLPRSVEVLFMHIFSVCVERMLVCYIFYLMLMCHFNHSQLSGYSTEENDNETIIKFTRPMKS